VFSVLEKVLEEAREHGKNKGRIKSTTHEQEVAEQMSYEGGG
jgi:hypothetical protein